MNILSPLTISRIIFILAMVNLISGIAILMSCRCIPGLKVVGNLMKYQWFRRFFKFHCYIWWIFWPSVIIHAILGIMRLGIPF